MTQQADVAVIGGGIVGLAVAWTAARAGKSVVLFERDRPAQGASVRNFGMVWAIGQPGGKLLQRALRSRRRWLELGELAGIAVNACGSLHLAYHDDEWAVLEEFVAARSHECRLLTPAETRQRCPAVRAEGLRGALWSEAELCVDPRQAIARLPRWLNETFGVDLQYGVPVRAVEMPEVLAADGRRWRVGRAVVCSGVDFQTLFPEVFAASGIRRCKLQMMRTGPQPDGWRLGPHVAGGLTLCHYGSFQDCPSLGRLRSRFEAELPDYLDWGIHVMASQNHLGEVVIGDSHEYDDAISLFDKTRIDDLILGYLNGLLELPDARIVERWHGIYAKYAKRPLFTAEPQPGAHIVGAPGGAGITMSFGWADDLWANWEHHS